MKWNENSASPFDYSSPNRTYKNLATIFYKIQVFNHTKDITNQKGELNILPRKGDANKCKKQRDRR